MSVPPLLLIGASGHARALMAVLARDRNYSPVGFIDSFKAPGELAHGLPILGAESDVPELCQKHGIHNVLVAIGDNFQRQAMTERLCKRMPGLAFPSLVDPTAVVASDVELRSGVVVMAQAHVGPGCVLKEGALVNTKASLDHDGQLGAFASLAPGVIAGGGVRVGEGSFIGLGSRLIHRVQIGAHSVLGAGSLLLSDLPSGVLAYGTPARVVRTRYPNEPYF